MATLHIEKFANAFLPDAVTSQVIQGQAFNAVNRYAKKHGGLWIGGKVAITVDGLSFMPNRLNKALHVGLEQVHIPLHSIRSVRREFGWFTGIVVVEYPGGTFRFRCYGASRVADELSAHVSAP